METVTFVRAKLEISRAMAKCGSMKTPLPTFLVLQTFARSSKLLSPPVLMINAQLFASIVREHANGLYIYDAADVLGKSNSSKLQVTDYSFLETVANNEMQYSKA